MIMSLVSVIVPVYNVALYIERCVRSLMEQTLDDVEFIFVNDATPDNSMEILRRILVEYPYRECRIIENDKNKGLAESRFVGFAIAKGKYIYHCDSDDWLELDLLEKMYVAAEDNYADMVFCAVFKESSNGAIVMDFPYLEENVDNGLLSLRLYDQYAAIWNKLVRRSLYEEHAITNYCGINMMEDTALTYRLRYFSKKTVVINEPLYHYNRMNASSMCATINDKSTANMLELAEKIDAFFKERGEAERFRTVTNYYKFVAKQPILRQNRDIRRWKSVFPESHKDIFKYPQITLLGKIKWWLCAHCSSI